MSDVNNPQNPPIEPQEPLASNVPNTDPTPTHTPHNHDFTKDPAVRALIETARRQEKDKLYKTIESKDEQIKALALKVEELEKELANKESAKMEEVKELQELVKGLQQQQADLLKELSDQKEKAEREKAEEADKRRKAELKAYKEQALRAAGDDLIIDLVGGETEEEIDASIERAKARFQEIAEKVTANVKASKEDKVKNLPKVTNPPSSSVQPLTMDEIRKMSPQEYAKHRSQILELARKGMLN